MGGGLPQPARHCPRVLAWWRRSREHRHPAAGRGDSGAWAGVVACMDEMLDVLLDGMTEPRLKLFSGDEPGP